MLKPNNLNSSFKDLRKIKDLFENKSFIWVFEDFLISEWLDTKLDVSNLSKLDFQEIYNIFCIAFSEEINLSKFIDFISFNNQNNQKNTLEIDCINNKMYSSWDIFLLLDLIQYSLDIYNKSKKYDIDIISLRIKDDIDSIIWKINYTSPSILLTSLWFSSIVKIWEDIINISKVFEDSIIKILDKDYIKIEDDLFNSYYIDKSWSILVLDNGRYLSNINKIDENSNYWLIMQITDDFRDTYIVINDEVFDVNRIMELSSKDPYIMKDFSIKKFDIGGDFYSFYEFSNWTVSKVFTQDLELLDVAWVLELIWFDLDDDNILDSTYMFLWEDIVKLEKFYNFEWLRFAKIKVRKETEFSSVTFMSEEERNEYIRKEHFFTFIVGSNWKILMSWEWNIVSDLLSKVNLLWKDFISYSLWWDKEIDWFIDYNSNFLTLKWEEVYDIKKEIFSFKDENIYKINNKDYVKESVLLNELEKYSGKEDKSVQLFFNKDDNIEFNWNYIDEIIILANWNKIYFRFNYLWSNIITLNYVEFVDLCKKNKYDKLLSYTSDIINQAL